MANTTARVAKNIHGTNPQFLVEKVIRSRIYDSTYWKEQCFALTAESLVDRAIDLEYIGGTYGIQKPTPFICLVCKLLQIQPDKEVILEYLRYPEFKYLRAVAAMYARLTFRPIDVYETLEPMLDDYRKLRFRQMSGAYTVTYMDEFIDELLTQERVCELILPRLTRRDVIEEVEGLAPRISKLEDAMLQGAAADGVTTGERDTGYTSDASDNSAKEELRQRRLRLERARRIREEREAADEERARLAMGGAGPVPTDGVVTEDTEEGEYPSQEEEDSDGGRYISRSPSRSRSASVVGSASDQQAGYMSRSPSRSPDREGGYVSRSPSRSPDRS